MSEENVTNAGPIATLFLAVIGLAWMAVIVCLPFAILWWIFS